MMVTQGVHSLIPRAYNYVSYMVKEALRMGLIKDLEMGDYPGLSGWAQCHH